MYERERWREEVEVIRPVIDSSRVVVSVFGLIKVIEHAFSFTLCKHGARHRDTLNCKCTWEFETITPLEQNGDGHVWCEINKKYPFSGKCFVSMATHLQLSFMKVILFANEASPATVGLERRHGSFRFDCGLYFWVLNNRLFYLLDSIKWLRKLERHEGWGEDGGWGGRAR